MFNKPLAGLAVLSLALLAGCGGGDEPQPEANDPNHAAHAAHAADAPGAGGLAQPAGGGGRQHAAAPPTSAQHAAGGQHRPAGGSRASDEASGAHLAALSSGQPIETSHIPASAVAAIYVQPSRILGSPTLASIDQDDMLQSVVDQLGADPRNIDLVVAAMMLDETQAEPTPNAGFIVRFKEPYDREQIGGTLFPADAREEVSLGSMTYYQNDDVAVHFADDRTLLVFQPEAAQAMLTPADASSPLVQALQAVGGGDDLLFVARVTDSMKQQIAEQKEMIQAQAGPAADLPEHFQTIVLRASIDPAVTLHVGIETDDPQVAQQLLQQTEQGIAMGKQQLAASREQIMESAGPFGTPLVNAANQILTETKPSASGRTFQVKITAPQQLNALIPLGVQMLVEQVRSARGAAEVAVNLNNLRQIGIALHNYHDTHGTFPAQANFEGDTPLLSWRVHILPFVDEQALYEQFKLDEPWDSEHNQALLEQIPQVYASAADAGSSEPGHTRILGVSGPGTTLEGTEGKSIAAMTDGSSNTVIVVEAAPDQSVPWTKPDDLDISNEEALQTLLMAGENGFLALFGDGRVQTLNPGIGMETLRNLFTIADGNPVEID